MTTADNVTLAAARLFHSTGQEVARKLGAIRLRARSVQPGDVIFEAGEPADCLYLLGGGSEAGRAAAEPLVQVRLAEEGGGRGLRYVRIVRGDVFGEAEFVAAGLDPKPTARISTARALTPGRVIGITWTDLAAVFAIEPAVSARLVRLATRRLLDAIRAQHSQGREDPDILLADWLVEFAADLGVASSNRVAFPQKLSQADIAAELDVRRETISRRLKEWERAGLLAPSGASFEIVDYARLVRIAGLRSGRDRDALARAVADVEAEVERGDLIHARNIAADMLRYFPASPELLHQLALAGARAGDGEEAVALLAGANMLGGGDLEGLRVRVQRALHNPFAVPASAIGDEEDEDGFDEEHDETSAPRNPRIVERLVADLAALEARVLKDQAFENGGQGDAAKAARSREAYEAVWRRVGSWYAGINAAAMALVAGDKAGAKRLAGEVLKRLPNDPEDYWAAATLAEAHFLSGSMKRGLAALARATEAADASDSARASTLLQLKRLAPHLDLSVAGVSAAIGVRSVALTTGHMFRGTEMDAAQQDAACEAVRSAVLSIFGGQNVGNVFGALACGADIVFAEAAIGAGIPFHAVLPFPIARYVETSVDIGDPPGAEGGWRKRFDAVLARAASLTLSDDEMPLERDLDGHFFHGFRFLGGLALMRAGILQSEARLIAVVDDARAANAAGSNRAVADWEMTGRPIDRIGFPFARKAPGARSRGASSFRPVVLLWDVADTGADEAALRSALKRQHPGKSSSGFVIVARSSRVGGEGTAIVAPSLQSALALAEACASVAAKTGPLRVIADFGPVMGVDMQPDARMIARLRAGSDMPGFPNGQALATLAFTAQAVFEFGSRLDVRAVGRAGERVESEGKARRRSGLPVYRLSLRQVAAK